MLLAFLSSDIISVSVIVSEDMYPSKVGGPASAPPVTGVPVAPNAFGGVENQPLWSTGLCDCMDDFGNCEFFCSRRPYRRSIAEMVDRGTTCKFLSFNFVFSGAAVYGGLRVRRR
ncbi:hypothetical protein B296_00056990 [Ensete ventricosum]|uniref:Uncharacterized protein n=1 Tax=Ensete ventricosum TaxID=4639 RepID=A0A426X6V0_ENSVE|nr:hypothetical protein B296_00056990 [Ensete ventricosum]